MGYGLHLHKCETRSAQRFGQFTLCGSVPADMMSLEQATSADVMGGRAIQVNGDLMTYRNRYWPTAAAVRTEAGEKGHAICTLPDCACRRYDDAAEDRITDEYSPMRGSPTQWQDQE